MAAIIAFLISLGVIMSPDEATTDLIDQYSEIINDDLDGY